MAGQPYRIGLTGTADGSGNATIKFTGQANLYYRLAMSVKLTPAANATWTLKVGPDQVGAGAGAFLTAGPIQMRPGETFELDVSGAGAGAVISGSLFGNISDRAEDVADLIAFVNNGISLSGTGAPGTPITIIGAGGGSNLVAYTAQKDPGGIPDQVVNGIIPSTTITFVQAGTYAIWAMAVVASPAGTAETTVNINFSDSTSWPGVGGTTPDTPAVAWTMNLITVKIATAGMTANLTTVNDGVHVVNVYARSIIAIKIG